MDFSNKENVSLSTSSKSWKGPSETPRTLIRGFLTQNATPNTPQVGSLGQSGETTSTSIPQRESSTIRQNKRRIAPQAVLSTPNALPVESVWSRKRRQRHHNQEETPRTLIRELTSINPVTPFSSNSSQTQVTQVMKQRAFVTPRETPTTVAKIPEKNKEEIQRVKPVRQAKETPRTFIRGFLDSAPTPLHSNKEDPGTIVVVGDFGNVNHERDAREEEEEEEENFFATNESFQSSHDDGSIAAQGEQHEDEEDGEVARGDENEDDDDPFADLVTNTAQYQRAKRSMDQVPLLSRDSLTRLSTPSSKLSLQSSLSARSRFSTLSSSSSSHSSPASLLSSLEMTPTYSRRLAKKSKRLSLSQFEPENFSSTPSLMPRTTLLQGEELSLRDTTTKQQQVMLPVVEPPANKRNKQPIALRRRALVTIQEENVEEDEDEENGSTGAKRSNATSHQSIVEGPHLPRALVKRLWSNLLKMSTNGVTSCDSEAVDAVEVASQKFFAQAAEDLSAYATHAGRQTIDVRDVACLMFRQRVATTDKQVQKQVRKHLSREYADQVIQKLQR